MTQAYSTYEDAKQEAIRRCRATGNDVAIRGHKEFGRMVYVVSYACVNDSDYARAEIVRSTDVGVVLPR